MLVTQMLLTQTLRRMLIIPQSLKQNTIENTHHTKKETQLRLIQMPVTRDGSVQTQNTH